MIHDLSQRRFEPKDLFWILVIALIFRSALATQPLVYHPDELWQYLEPAYGKLTGHWIKTWEYRLGIRGWFVPMLLYPALALGHAIAPQSSLHLLMVREFVSILSLGTVAAFYFMGRSISRPHAIVAGFVGAVWTEIFFFGPRTSGDALAVSAIIPAIALLYCAEWRRSSRLAFLSGLLLALVIVIRFQLAPALAIIGLYAIWRRDRIALLPLIVGGICGLTLSALADIVAGEVPFQWMVRNFTVNLVQNKSASFGVEPFYWYFLQIGRSWLFLTPVIVGLALIGARRFPLILTLAVIVLLSHSLIPHKEWRFILLTIILLVFLAAIGSVDLAKWFLRHRKATDFRLAAMVSAIWFAMSVYVAAFTSFVDNWGQSAEHYRSLIAVGEDQRTCGVALFEYPWTPMASYAFVNRNVPILHIAGPSARANALKLRESYNMVITRARSIPDLPSDYKVQQCNPGFKPFKDRFYCILTRPGPCSKAPEEYTYNRQLELLGK